MGVSGQGGITSATFIQANIIGSGVLNPKSWSEGMYIDPFTISETEGTLIDNVLVDRADEDNRAECYFDGDQGCILLSAMEKAAWAGLDVSAMVYANNNNFPLQSISNACYIIRAGIQRADNEPYDNTIFKFGAGGANTGMGADGWHVSIRNVELGDGPVGTYEVEYTNHEVEHIESDFFTLDLVTKPVDLKFKLFAIESTGDYILNKIQLFADEVLIKEITPTLPLTEPRIYPNILAESHEPSKTETVFVTYLTHECIMYNKLGLIDPGPW